MSTYTYDNGQGHQPVIQEAVDLLKSKTTNVYIAVAVTNTREQLIQELRLMLHCWEQDKSMP